jgi:DNA-binding IclR family transcriptional regulator
MARLSGVLQRGGGRTRRRRSIGADRPCHDAFLYSRRPGGLTNRPTHRAMSTETPSNGRVGIQVIARAGLILRALSTEREGLTLSELAARVELPRTTVHRIITALSTEGLVAAVSPNGRVRLGSEIARLNRSQAREVRGELLPLMHELSQRIDETVDLSILLHDRVSFVDQASPFRRLRAVSGVGDSFPAYCTANGKALLALQTDAAVRRLLPERLEALTPHTITDRKTLIEALADVRQQGYATDREEHTVGVSAVGAVVLDRIGPVVAVSIPVPTPRFTGNESMLAEAVLNAAADMSLALGALP